MATQAAREQVPQAPYGLTVDALCGSITGEALLPCEAEHDCSALCQLLREVPGNPPEQLQTKEAFMHMFLSSVVCGTITLLAWSAGVFGQEVVKGEFASPKTDEEMIANALSAAPASIAKNATVIAFDANGKVRTLRKGSNNFTCIPDDPTNPANDPNCVDANGLEWIMAWVNKTEPPKGKVGFGYMLQGGTTPSNVDPFATKPPTGKWMQEPPHVMVFNYGGEAITKDYPRPGEMADMTQPWVMWAGSPYEHLMLPVK